MTTFEEKHPSLWVNDNKTYARIEGTCKFDKFPPHWSHEDISNYVKACVYATQLDRKIVGSVIHGWGSLIPKEKLQSLSDAEYQSICQVIMAINNRLRL